MANMHMVVGTVTVVQPPRDTGKWGMAIDFSVQDYANGNYQVRCSCLGKNAEYIMRYVSAGTLVSVSGTMQARTWVNQQGQERTSSQLKLASVEIVGATPTVAETPQPQPQAPPARPTQASNLEGLRSVREILEKKIATRRPAISPITEPDDTPIGDEPVLDDDQEVI